MSDYTQAPFHVNGYDAEKKTALFSFQKYAHFSLSMGVCVCVFIAVCFQFFQFYCPFRSVQHRGIESQKLKPYPNYFWMTKACQLMWLRYCNDKTLFF